jgi:formate hydrogenlyase subunit 3/multisubunit Na+/H+ antiporter MnhD subunit
MPLILCYCRYIFNPANVRDGSKQIGGIRALRKRFPVQSALWLAGAAAIAGAPPSGLFQSELAILRAGLVSRSSPGRSS